MNSASTGPNLARRAVEIFLHQWRLVEGQPISVEALERPVEENRPQPNPVEGAGTGPIVIGSGSKTEHVTEIVMSTP